MLEIPTRSRDEIHFQTDCYGQQEGSAYNGHFGCTCYHPLFCFNQFSDLERALLREGNVSSAHDWRSVLEPIVARYRDLDIRRFFRGDAAFAKPGLYEYLEAEDYLYAIRDSSPEQSGVVRQIEHLLTRPAGSTGRIWDGHGNEPVLASFLSASGLSEAHQLSFSRWIELA